MPIRTSGISHSSRIISKIRRTDMKSVFRFLASGLLLIVVSAVAFAQAQTGGITGVVSDKAGAVVNGASVEVINESGITARSTTTGTDGGYAVTLLPPGKYKLEITAKNFKKAVIAGVDVRILETSRQD